MDWWREVYVQISQNHSAKVFSLDISKSKNNLRKKRHLILETIRSLTSATQSKDSECEPGTGWIRVTVIPLPSTQKAGSILSKWSYLYHPFLRLRESSQPISNFFKPIGLMSRYTWVYIQPALQMWRTLKHSPL